MRNVSHILAVLGMTVAGVPPGLAAGPDGAVAHGAVPVVVAPVRQSDVPIVLSGIGTVQALNAAVIRSQVTGQLVSVDFQEGQAVHRGDLLAQIDPRTAQAHLAETEAQLSRDQAQLDNVQVNLGRNLPLLTKGFATDQQVTDQKAQIAQLQAAIQSDRALIDDARTTLSYTSLTAPFDGVTGVRTLDVGNVIHPTDAAGVVTVTQVQPISVLFVLPAADIPQVQAALAAGSVTAVAFDQTGTHRLDSGRLLLINNLADPTSGTVQLKAQFPNAERQLWPGTFVNVEVTVRTVKDGLTVPTEAVQQGANGEFVFVIGSDHRVAAQTVQVEQRDRGVALIGRGLKPGETVVAQGQYRLVDGTEVVSAPPEQVANTSTGSAGMLP